MILATVAKSGSGNSFATVANTVNRTALINYTDQSSKYMRNWHRLKTVFTAPSSGRLDVVLRAGREPTARRSDSTTCAWSRRT